MTLGGLMLAFLLWLYEIPQPNVPIGKAEVPYCYRNQLLPCNRSSSHSTHSLHYAQPESKLRSYTSLRCETLRQFPYRPATVWSRLTSQTISSEIPARAPAIDCPQTPNECRRSAWNSGGNSHSFLTPAASRSGISIKRFARWCSHKSI